MKMRKLSILLLLLAPLAAGCANLAVNEKKPPEKCANCHSGSLVFKEWQNSGHANSLRTLLKDLKAGRKCVKCHSADYKPVGIKFWAYANNVPLPRMAGNPVSCSACHKHDSGLESNLMMPADAICMRCHILLCGG